jgi:hypothetical protein
VPTLHAEIYGFGCFFDPTLLEQGRRPLINAVHRATTQFMIRFDDICLSVPAHSVVKVHFPKTSACTPEKICTSLQPRRLPRCLLFLTTRTPSRCLSCLFLRRLYSAIRSSDAGRDHQKPSAPGGSCIHTPFNSPTPLRLPWADDISFPLGDPWRSTIPAARLGSARLLAFLVLCHPRSLSILTTMMHNASLWKPKVKTIRCFGFKHRTLGATSDEEVEESNQPVGSL